MTQQTKPHFTFKEYCERMGWGYPLPEPGTPEAKQWIDERMVGRADGETFDGGKDG